MREGFTEYIEVEIETAVYVQSITVGENRGSWSVVKIKAWDSSTSRWQTLYGGDADPVAWQLYKDTSQYNHFEPSLCQTTFAASAIRIEMDTYKTADWNEFDYVKVVGSTTLKTGVLMADVTTQTARVMYVPDINFCGVDSFTFVGCDCAYDSGRVSQGETVTVSVLPVNDLPVAQSSAVAADCASGVPDEIVLIASDVDAIADANTSIEFSITSLPGNAALYDAGSGATITPTSLPAAVSGATLLLLADYYELADPPSGFVFMFTATDELGAVSTEASIVVTCSETECSAGEYYDMTYRACAECPSGTFASDIGIRSSCEACAAGKFAPSEGSMSCGSCAFGQVALVEGSTACVVCPAGATCDDASSLAVNPGMWRGSFDPFKIYECPFGTRACLGGTTIASFCELGYGGVLCGVCQEGFVHTIDRCSPCDALNAPATLIILVAVAGVIVLSLWYLTRFNKRFAAALESISVSVPFKIYFAACQVQYQRMCVFAYVSGISVCACVFSYQILGAYTALLSDVLVHPLKAFLSNLTFFSDLADFFGGFGVSCAHHEMRTFRARLLISTVLPIVLSLCIAASFVVQALSHPDRARAALRRTHTTAVLLVLYVTLPSTSTLIFKTFVRDSRPLGTNGEQYLMADYAGRSSQHNSTHCLFS